MCIEFLTWLLKTKEYACLFSCWDGTLGESVAGAQKGLFKKCWVLGQKAPGQKGGPIWHHCRLRYAWTLVSHRSGSRLPSCQHSFMGRSPTTTPWPKTREGCGCPKLLAGEDFQQISTLLEYHGVGNFYLINSRKLQIGIGIGKFSIINSEELHIGNFGGTNPWRGIGIGIGKRN